MADFSFQAGLSLARANIDQQWAGARDVLFELGLAQVTKLGERLDQPDAPRWLRDQSDDGLRLIALLAGVTAVRMSLEVIDGILDGEGDPAITGLG